MIKFISRRPLIILRSCLFYRKLRLQDIFQIMIVKVFNNKGQEESSHSFKQKQVVLGRNPKVYNSVLIDAESVSRSHLAIYLKNGKIKVKDLNSSNGTFVNKQQITKNQKVLINKNDKITLGQFEGYVTVRQRQAEHKKRNSSSDQSEQSERQRSRDKKSKQSQIQLAESTLKMLRSMTADKKSKAQKVKFLKLMGYVQAQECWEEIQQMIKRKKTYFLSNANKKASQQLQKQFSLSRSGHQKKGLGR